MDQEPKSSPNKGRTMVGLFLLVCVAVIIMFASIKDTLGAMHLWSALILGTVGGLLTDPATFKGIAADLIDNLPGGKK